MLSSSVSKRSANVRAIAGNGMGASTVGLTIQRLLCLLLAALLVGGCVRMKLPDNTNAALYDPEKTASTSHTPSNELTYVDNYCPEPGTPNYIEPAATKSSLSRGRRRKPLMRYSSGDRFRILILGSPEFSGDYAVNVDGNVILPYAGSVTATGLTNKQLTGRIRRRLVKSGIFSAEADQISVQPVQYAPVNITVAGAVFRPGRYTINAVREQNKLNQLRTKSGDSPIDRFVPAALQAAGGVRPDADLSNVVVHRNGRKFKLNWRGAITGQPVDDLPLIEGDHVEIAEAGCYQSALVRPSQITPESVRVFLSNLTVPSLSNANSVQNQNTSAGFPYGTRMLQALVQANCVGGTYATNAHRYGVLISRNPKTRKTEVVQRSIEDLVRSADRDRMNPLLLPEDAIACYDSSVTEFRDVMSVIYSTVLPGTQVIDFVK